jgi:hypothetical protein
MDLKALGEQIAKLGLPLLGAALPIPGGAAIGAALASALGTDGTPEATAAALLDPAALQKAREFEATHAEAMLKLQIEQEANEAQAAVSMATIDAGDTASARDREVKTGDVWTPRVLAILIFAAYAFVEWFVLTHVVPLDSRDLAARGMGTLDMGVGLILGYYYGSSVHGARTTELLAKAGK